MKEPAKNAAPEKAALAPKSAAQSYDTQWLLGLYRRMVLIRQFEERVKFLFLEGVMPGTIHQCQGQENGERSPDSYPPRGKNKDGKHRKGDGRFL